MKNIIDHLERGNDNIIGGPSPVEHWKPILIDFIRESCNGIIDQSIITAIIKKAERIIKAKPCQKT